MKNWIYSLFYNVRFYVLIVTLLLSGGIYFIACTRVEEGPLRVIALTQYFALFAVFYLYLTLLIGPLVRIFPKIPYRGLILKARRGTGVCVFYFAVLHVWNAFFDYLGGLDGIFALPQNAQIAVLYAAFAFIIFFLMFLTATDWAIHKLGKNWKRLHRLVYLALFLIFLHAITMGHHFQNLGNWVSRIFFFMFLSLLFFHGLGLWKMFKRTRIYRA